MTRLSPFPLTDFIFRWGIFFLLLFAPLAYGSVEPWSRAVVTVSVSLLCLVWIIREFLFPEMSREYRRNHSYLKDWTAGLSWPAVAFLAVALVQVVPLWEPVLKVLSPGSVKAFELAGYNGVGTISVAAGSTWTAAAHAAAMLLFFFFALNTLRTREDIRRFVRILLLIGFAVALFSIIQSIALSRTIIWNPENRLAAPFGPYVNRNHFAGWMTMLVPLGFGYFLSIGHRKSRRNRGEAESGEQYRSEKDVRARRVLAAFILAVMTGSLLLSLSRAGFLSVLLAFAAIGLYLAVFERSGGKLWLLLGTAGLTLVLALWLGGGAIAERLGTLKPLLADPMGESRLTVWKDTLLMVADFPLLGSGLGTYGEVFPLYQGFESTALFTHAEHDYIQLLAEAGTFGLIIALSGLLISSVKIGKILLNRRVREVRYLTIGGAAGLTAFLLHSSTTFNFHIPSNALYFSFITALTLKISFSKL